MLKHAVYCYSTRSVKLAILSRCCQLMSVALLIFLCLFFTTSVKATNAEVSLQLKWFHQFQFAGFYAAQKEGYFAEEGLTVDIRQFDFNVNPVDSVLTGEADFAIADSSLVLSKLEGKPVVVMAAIFQKSPLALMTLNESKLTNPLDLIGKKVMFRRQVDDAVIAAMFAELGVRDKDFTHVPHTFNDDELINGNIDAMSVYVTDQPYYYQEKGYRVNIIQPANYGIDSYGDLIFTSKEYLLDYTKQALAFRRAALKGWQYALENQEQVIDWMLANLDVNKTKDQLMFEAKQTERMINPNLIELGTLNKNRFQRIADIYQQRNPGRNQGDLENFLYEEVISPLLGYKQIAYISWAILALLFIVAIGFISVNKRLQVLVAQRTQELEQSKISLAKLVVTDELTGAGNRCQLNQFFDQEVEKSIRYERPLSIILFDVDYFKRVNDEFGHACGDKVLIALTNLVQAKVRSSDLLGRWGGEEFLLICPETPLIGACQNAELLREIIENFAFEENISITCSFGVAQWQENETKEHVFGRCDNALYQAKDGGRNRVEPAR